MALRSSSRLVSRTPTFAPTSIATRLKSTSSAPPTNEAATAQLSPRWLSETKSRIGKCITFGLTPDQTASAGEILKTLVHDWRELVAGSEGWLTSPERRGLHRWPVAWGDQDSMGHVNNVVYNRYAESGRVAWVHTYAKYVDPAHADVWSKLGTPFGEVGMILRAIKTEFKFPMKYPDHISVYHKLSSEPNESTDAFRLQVLILSELHQRPAARLEEDCALYDYKKNKKTSMPPWMAGVLQETWRLQEEAKRVNSTRVRSLLDQVRQLEKESWDRADAVEAMGNGGSR